MKGRAGEFELGSPTCGDYTTCLMRERIISTTFVARAGSAAFGSIIGRDEAHPPVARVLRRLADAEILWSAAAQSGAISGRGCGVDFFRAAAEDAARSEFQFATRVSGVEREQRKRVIRGMVRQIGWLCAEFSQFPKYKRHGIECCAGWKRKFP